MLLLVFAPVLDWKIDLVLRGPEGFFFGLPDSVCFYFSFICWRQKTAVTCLHLHLFRDFLTLPDLPFRFPLATLNKLFPSGFPVLPPCFMLLTFSLFLSVFFFLFFFFFFDCAQQGLSPHLPLGSRGVLLFFCSPLIFFHLSGAQRENIAINDPRVNQDGP